MHIVVNIFALMKAYFPARKW